MATLFEKVVGDLGDKRRWRQYKARTKALPAGGRSTVEALEKYLLHFGVMTKGDVPTDVVIPMFEDLVEVFEKASTTGTPIREVVGDDPVEFAETFFRNYSDGRWINRLDDPSLTPIERDFHTSVQRGMDRERQRLLDAVGSA